jgi:adenylyltransferase and sulfurtransferase
MEILKHYDVIVDATDNVATRYLLNDACVLLKKPLVSGSALMFEGQLTVYNYNNGPCYRCIFPKPPPPETVMNCGDGGVIGAVTGTIGSLQAMEVLKIIHLNKDEVLSGQLLLYDGLSCSFRKIKLRGRKENCEVCGNAPSITELIDYEQFCGMKASDKDSGLKLLSEDERISVQNFRKLNQEHMLIDVRSEAEFEICKLENSHNIPIKQLLSSKIDVDLMNRLKHEDVYVVCRRGNDSQIAVRYLQEKLDIKSKDIIGGLHAWTKEIDENFPIY